MALEFDRNGRIYLVVDIDSCLLIDLSSRTFFSFFMLIPLSFGKPEFISNFDDKHFRLALIENDGSTYWLVFMDFQNELPWIDSQRRRTIVGKLIKKFLCLLIPILRLRVVENFVKVIVKGLFSLVGQPVGIL